MTGLVGVESVYILLGDIKKLQPRSKFLGRINNKFKSSKDTDMEELVEA